jgi:hypothetical protein
MLSRVVSKRLRWSLPVSRRVRLLAAVFVGLSGPSLASAATISLDDVENWVGDGPNRAGLVIDWKDGKTPASLIWGYRWTGTATGLQMINAVVAADPRLYGHQGVFSFGTVFFGLGYDVDGDGFGVSPALAFDGGGLAVGSAPANDNRAPTDADDHYRDGWSTGYWSYWTGDGTSWTASMIGAADRILTNGTYDGWSFAPGFVDTAPADPVAAVPEPTSAIMVLVGAAGLLVLRRRRRGVAMTAAIGLAAAAVSPSAFAYTYDPNDFAVEVVATTGDFGPAPYDDATALLGRPTLRFNNSLNPFTPDLRRAKPIEAPFNVGPSGEKLLVTIAEESSVTVRMGRPVTNDPQNPFGIDFIVFGNAFYSGTGATVSETTDLTAFTISGSVAAEPVKVSVSPDGITWYRYESGPFGDTAFPTNGYLWDRNTLAWTAIEADPTRPVDPTLSVAGMSAADVLDAYAGSAGGTGFDLAQSGFDSIQFVRIEGLTGFANGEIDAIADVRPVPEPSAGLVTAGLVGGVLLRRQRLATT